MFTTLTIRSQHTTEPKVLPEKDGQIAACYRSGKIDVKKQDLRGKSREYSKKFAKFAKTSDVHRFARRLTIGIPAETPPEHFLHHQYT